MKDIDFYRIKKKNTRGIGSVSTLKKILGIQDSDIDDIEALLSSGNAYTKLKTKKFKGDGSERPVYNPHYKIRNIQRLINLKFFRPRKLSLDEFINDTSSKSPNTNHKKTKDLIIWPNYLFGSVPKSDLSKNELGEGVRRDYIACASVHCRRKSILKVDISDFYENIHVSDVEKIFEEIFYCSADVSRLLANFCCYEGRVPQGGLTSSFIAMMVLYDVEPRLVQRLEKKNLRYTRLVDDITVSSQIEDFDFSLTLSLIKDMLREKDLPINEKKLLVSTFSCSSTLVHGLRVNFDSPRLPQGEVSNIRASVKRLELIAKDSTYKISRDYRKDFNHCLGRVNRMKSIGHKQAEGLIVRLSKIKPLPSYRDIVYCNKMISFLESRYVVYGDRYWFRKRCYLLNNELNILQRSFYSQAKAIRDRLKVIFPVG